MTEEEKDKQTKFMLEHAVVPTRLRDVMYHKKSIRDLIVIREVIDFFHAKYPEKNLSWKVNMMNKALSDMYYYPIKNKESL